MKKAVVNYWVDMITGVAFLLCAITGIVRLFPEVTTISSAGAPAILGVSTALWTTIHDWSGVIMAAGVGLHTVLHLRWLAFMTRKLAGAGRTERATRERHERAGAAVGATLAANTARPTTPQVVAAESLERLQDMGGGPADRRLDSRRMDRRAFLAGAVTLGGAALLVGLGIAGSETVNAVSSDGDDAGSGWGGDQGGSSASGSSEPDSSGGSTSSTRVAVDSRSCVGCGACLQVCPQGVFSWDGSKATVHTADACSLCGRCLQVCRPQSITLNG